MKNNEKIKEMEFGDVNRIYGKILEVYPFLTSKEKKIFESKTKNFILNEQLFKKDKIDFLNFLLKCLKNSHAEIVLHKNKVKNKKVRYFQEYRIDNNILYIRIYRWSAPNHEEAERRGKELIDICVKNRADYKGIIFDVRGNSGGYSVGADNLATIFFKKDFISAYLYRMENGKLIKKPRILKHNPEYYIDVPIVVLIDGKCFSSNELFISPFKVSKRAILIGQTTKGGSANPLILEYMIGRQRITVKIPTWRLFLKGNKKPLEQTKIKPDIVYKKDNIIEYARTYSEKIISSSAKSLR